MTTLSMSALGGKADIPASPISGLLMTQSEQQAPVAFALYFPQAMGPRGGVGARVLCVGRRSRQKEAAELMCGDCQ
jgi:hypothetical protein